MTCTSKRILAHDRARAWAIIGMIFVNATKLMGTNSLKPWWADTMITFITGRAAAVFVMLAGAGIVMAYDRASDIAKPLLKTRLIIRASLLCMIGFLLKNVWNPDILHYYTAYIIGGVILLERSTNQLKKLLGMLVLASMPICALVTYDYEGGDIIGEIFDEGPLAVMVNYFFLSEHYPVLPWFCFFLAGMILGRLERLSGKGKFYSMFAGSSLLLIAIELLSTLLNAETITGRWFEIEMPEWRAFSLSEAFPVGPLFVFSAGASSLALISFLRLLPKRAQASGDLSPLVAFGRLSLTFYVTHILVGHAFFQWVTHQHGKASSNHTLFFATVFVLAGIVFADRWMRHFRRGPLETAMDTLMGVLLNPKEGTRLQVDS